MVRLDFYIMKAQWTQYIIIPIIGLIFSKMGSNIIILSITAAWIIILINNNIFAIQEKNNLERLYSTLSVNRQIIVLGRYFYLLINFIMSFIIILFTNIAMNWIRSVTDFKDIFIAFGVSLCIFSFISAIQTPIFFKMGYTKGKIAAMFPFLAVMVLLVLPSFLNRFVSISRWAIAHQRITILLSLVLSGFFLIISYYISIICCRSNMQE